MSYCSQSDVKAILHAILYGAMIHTTMNVKSYIEVFCLVCLFVCVCVFIRLHMTAQSGPVILFSHSVVLALILPNIFVALCVLRVRRSWDPRVQQDRFFSRAVVIFSLSICIALF